MCASPALSVRAMKQIENQNERGEKLTATFLPDRGMNLISLKRGNIEAIDQNTRPLFEERCAGLGALIGPHFHHRKNYEIPTNFPTHLFPHIARIKKKGTNEPFSHGIARYVPWTATSSKTQITATLKSSDEFHGMKLRDLEGQDFEMHFEATMMSYGLFIRYRVESEKPSVLGLHYYYALDGKSEVIADVQNHYRKGDEWLDLPEKWQRGGKLHFNLDEEADYGFQPQDPLEENRILLSTGSQSLRIFYDTTSRDNSWQLFHPKGSSYACIEPLTAKNPQAPTHTSSLLEVRIELFEKLSN